MLGVRLGWMAFVVLTACGATQDDERVSSVDGGDAATSKNLVCHPPTENTNPGCPRTLQEGGGLPCSGSPMRCEYPYSGDTNPAAGRPCPGFARLNCDIKGIPDGGTVGRWAVEMSARAGSEPIAD